MKAVTCEGCHMRILSHVKAVICEGCHVRMLSHVKAVTEGPDTPLGLRPD